jgi:hypothetical protein
VVERQTAECDKRQTAEEEEEEEEEWGEEEVEERRSRKRPEASRPPRASYNKLYHTI